ncbi:MAG: polysaccharide biosynthesis/export family protein [Hyphomicrobiales bacterium]
MRAILRYSYLVCVLGIAASNCPASKASACSASDTNSVRSDAAVGPDHTWCTAQGDRSLVGTDPNVPKFQIGDKVNIAVFEHLDREEDKWGSGQQRPRDLSHSFLQRPEMSGEHVVQEDGTISLPLLGQITVAGTTSRDLELSIAGAFEQAFGRSGFASVLSVEHSAVYIVGPVKNPGSYKYVPGMTVLHVVALAGGLDRSSTEPWEAVESVRQTHQAQRSLATMARALARRAVLQAERDGAPVPQARQLVMILGDVEARTAIADQIALRSLVVNTRRARETMLKSSIESARSDLEAAKGRIGPLDALIKMRAERMSGLSGLVNRGVVERPMLLQAQSDLSEVQVRRQDALASISSAKRRFDQAVEEETTFQLEARSELELEIAALDREATETWPA